MAIVHEWEERGLVTRYLGEIAGNELIASTLELSGNSFFDDAKYAISDWSKTTKTDISIKKVHELVAFIEALSRTNPGIVNPTILPKDTIGRNLVAQYIERTKSLPWKTEMFDSEDEAREWIDRELSFKR